MTAADVLPRCKDCLEQTDAGPCPICGAVVCPLCAEREGAFCCEELGYDEGPH